MDEWVEEWWAECEYTGEDKGDGALTEITPEKHSWFPLCVCVCVCVWYPYHPLTLQLHATTHTIHRHLPTSCYREWLLQSAANYISQVCLCECVHTCVWFPLAADKYPRVCLSQRMHVDISTWAHVCWQMWDVSVQTAGSPLYRINCYRLKL